MSAWSCRLSQGALRPRDVPDRDKRGGAALSQLRVRFLRVGRKGIPQDSTYEFLCGELDRVMFVSIALEEEYIYIYIVI